MSFLWMRWSLVFVCPCTSSFDPAVSRNEFRLDMRWNQNDISLLELLYCSTWRYSRLIG